MIMKDSVMENSQLVQGNSHWKWVYKRLSFLAAENYT